MNEYPVWNLQGTGGAWLIGLIATIHVYVANFAIGGGLYLAVTESISVKRKDYAVIEFLRSFGNFLLLLTTVFGALGGVAIWFAIGLVSPPGTSALIHNFVWFWAAEWVVFLTEIAVAFVYYYSWGKVSDEFHVKLGWLYFGIAIFSLIIINGILTFMLTPGNWLQTRSPWQAFFNPTYFPSLFLRIIVLGSVAGLFAIVASSRIKEESLRIRMLHYSAKWLLPAFFLMPFAMLWYMGSIPAESAKMLVSGISNIAAGNLSILTRVLLMTGLLSVTIYLVGLFGPFLSPKNFSFGMALTLLFLGLIATGATESSRETIRKPYVIFNYMYSNGLLASAAKDSSNIGILKHNRWLSGITITPQNSVEVGEKIFRTQCNTCHTTTGYRAIRDLATGWDNKFIFQRITSLQNTGIMPPFMGDAAERQALADFISKIVEEQEPKR